MEKAQLELGKILSVKCPLHPSEQSFSLHVAASAAYHWACIDCIIKRIVPISATIALRTLF